MKELSVLMPVYNTAPFLDESIHSILNQSYTDFEFIILDDCSTDNSLKIIQSYAKKDNRIKILQNKQNKKEATCRNILLKSAKTEFIAWMDADDISLPDRLQTQLAFLKNNPKIDIVGSQIKVFGTTSSIINLPLSDYEIKTMFLLACPIINAATMFRMKKIRKHKILYNEKLPSAPDFQFCIDCCSFASFANINKILYKYRFHQQQTTKKSFHICSYQLVLRNHLLKFGVRAELLILLITNKLKKIPKKDLDKIRQETKKIIQIKSFYNYPTPDKMIILKLIHQTIITSLLTKAKKIAMEMFFKARIPNIHLKEIVSFLKNCDISKKEILKIFYRIIIKKIKNNFKKIFYERA